MRQKYKGQDIRARLHHTIIRYKNHPYLAEVNESNQIGLRDLANNNLIALVEHDDPLIDISSISIGYVNVTHPDIRSAVYLKREPLRRFKQGIEFDMLTQIPLRTGMSSFPKSVVLSRGFVNAVLGKFPSFKESLKLISDGWYSVALSRDVAFKRETNLLKVFIKDTEVGILRLGTDIINVPKSEVSYCYVDILRQNIPDVKVVEGLK